MRPSPSITMHLSTCAILLLVATCVAGANDKTSEIEKAFTDHFLVPLILESAPPLELSVRYSCDVVHLGNKIPAYAASIPPYIYYEADPKCLYTILIIDADGSCVAAPGDREFLHACLVNTPGNNLEKSTYLTTYFPMNMPPGSGYHRIVIVVFKQTKKIDTTSPYMQNLHRNNTRFSTKHFASTYGLGKPIAGNFFLTHMTVCAEDQGIAYTCSV